MPISFIRKSLALLYLLFVIGLLTACSGQAMSLFKPKELQWVRITFENATQDKVFDVYVQWCKYRYIVPIPGIQEDMIPGGGGGTSGDYYCNEPLTMHWTDNNGKSWSDTILLDQKSFPKLGIDQYGQDEGYQFIATIYEDHATVTTHIRSRELAQSRNAIIYERRDRYYARELKRLRPYIEKTRQDYAGWEVADVIVSSKQAFDYRQGNTLVKLIIHDTSYPMTINAKGEKTQLDELDLLRTFRDFESYREGYRDYKKVLDIRMMPGQLERKLELYNQRYWNISEGKVTDSLFKRLAKEYGIEVKISELNLADE